MNSKVIPWLALPLLAAGLTVGCDDGDGDATPSVVINEFTSAENDEIELYNPTSQAIDLSGWILTDDVVNPDQYDVTLDDECLIFASGTLLPAGGYLVIAKGDAAGDHPFGIRSGGETLSLLDADGALVDQITYQSDQAETSYCRVPDGDDAWQRCTATFGTANAAE